MLKITDIATNTEFELPRNMVIPFNFFNPIFEESKSSTLSATMSARSATNRRLTGNFHRPGKPDNSGALIPVWFECTGQRKRSTLQILEADEDEIKFNLLFDEASFMVAHGEKLINECDMGGEHLILNMTMDLGFNWIALPDWDDDMYKKQYPEVGAVFPPAFNSNFFDGTTYEDAYKARGMILNAPISVQRANNPQPPGQLIDWYDSSIYPVVPMPFLMSIIDYIFQSGALKITKNSLNIAPFNQLILLNDIDNAKASIYVNDGVATYNTSNRGFYNISNHVPQKTIKSFLGSLRGKFNVVPFINDSDNTVRLINIDDILKTPVNINDDLSSYAYTIRLKTIPSYTGFEFIDNCEKSEFYKSFYIDFKEIENKIILPEVKWEDIQNGYYKLNGIYKVDESSRTTSNKIFGNSYFQLGLNELTNDIRWNFLGYSDIGNIYLGEKTNRMKFETEFGCTLSNTERLDTTMQVHSSPGISELINLYAEKKFGMFLAFYYPVTNTNLKPMTSYFDSSDYSNYENILINGTEKGTINKFFKHTMAFFEKKGKTFETTLSLPISKLLNFDWAKKYKINEGTFLVKNIKGEFNFDGTVTYKSAEVVEV